MVKPLILVLLLLTGCATTKPDTCDDCLTLTKANLVKAMQSAWNDGYTKGWDKGEDSVACMRSL
ncbi:MULTISPECIES: hypothetical protein [unclassified Polaromonas]|jgi:hypothetical protein|uniref:hypothetical protein n=1 Tax=unclassified Polaromonas TaxID=2638319 RepID=UPI000BC5E4FC|nr:MULTISPECIES: hypothetical protein [unclassified Polaromonas]OYY34796.1 MAG: hypothetical protein B7Y60_15265 [Polaromonas sp. 35-63-35]OYZ77557.1 MAG: hypothetical protein B7Y09_16425 [Polaromonas sp. 24-63-21]OZA48460.1 MAG: hypothetical protein B7X88_18095 [Polaromonas sp. 17-63-33]OZA87208.1 MAG: hypothetical protein B7X65_13565 [Polaromonas sp. 39-63-25]HQR98170.1 hypothetical protein [Polaromonas sp.]